LFTTVLDCLLGGVEDVCLLGVLFRADCLVVGLLLIGVDLSSVGVEDVCLLGVLFCADCLVVGLLYWSGLSLVQEEDVCLLGVSLFVDFCLVGVSFTTSDLADLHLGLVALGAGTEVLSFLLLLRNLVLTGPLLLRFLFVLLSIAASSCTSKALLSLTDPSAPHFL
jgi:hypothetical protein